MSNEEAAKLVMDAFRGVRCRFERDGILDLIVGRMTPVLVDAAHAATERAAKIADEQVVATSSRIALGKLIRETA